jgi:ribonuclease D
MEGGSDPAHNPTPYEWIDSTAALAAFLDAVGDARLVGMDLEADNLHHYKEQLCLIQMHAGGRTVLIDPFGLESCAPLLEFLDNPHRELWMHGADFDMTLMLAAFDWLPARIHDTQIAAQLVGRRQFGLASLVDHYFGLVLSKSSQKEDWSRRPLPAKMCEYAARDASILMPLKDHLMAEIDAVGRRDWFLQSCSAARRQAITRTPRDSDELWRIQGWGGLKGRELAFLKELWIWRDAEARRRDVPTFKVLAGQDLLEMARQLNTSGEARVKRRLSREAREDLTAMVARVRDLPQSEWPQRIKTKRRAKPEEFDGRYDRLKAHRDAKAHQLGLDPSVLAPRKVLEMLALGDDAEERPNLLPWQREVLDLESIVW